MTRPPIVPPLPSRHARDSAAANVPTATAHLVRSGSRDGAVR
ncbi:MAG TPA: hypothetical protein VG317_00425 [Pseudonocardiaceae bacterium]|nr:hypothetical protein [Pseudonocardiaceae bacterium]